MRLRQGDRALGGSLYLEDVAGLSAECQRLLLRLIQRGPQADGPRYKQIGNGVTVPVIEYLGELLHAADERHRHAYVG